MKIAYLISAYKDAKQFGRMINALRGNNTHFFIHVDAKAEQGHFEAAVPEGMRGHVHFTRKRYWVQWGGFNQVRYQKEMLREALSAGIDFDRIFILTAQDYPLWSNGEIEKELVDNPAKEYIIALNISWLIEHTGGGQTKRQNYIVPFLPGHESRAV